MENIKVGDVVFTKGAGDYETKLSAIITVGKKIVYIFNDLSSDYLRAYFMEDLNNNFVLELKKEEVEELTVEEISTRLGKTIKVVK